MPGEHLLVIDDSPTLLKVVESTLTRAGYRVDTAADGAAGLLLVRGSRTVPDLILLDGVIPGSDSAEICRELAGDDAPRARPRRRHGQQRRGPRDPLRAGAERR